MKRLSTLALSLVFSAVQWLYPAAALAQSAPGPVNLNLGSTEPTEVAQHAGTIIVGGASQQIEFNQLITPAERVALAQVFHTGVQSIVLAAGGNAVGGAFNLSYAARNGASSLVIPAGVMGVQDVSVLSSLVVTGNLVNSGTLQAVSQNSAVNRSVISALNIANMQTGVITSVLPVFGLAGFTPATSILHLTLNAAHNITNQGIISSSGDLNLSAGGLIVNALPAGVAGARPALTAADNLSIVTSSLTNAGLISALNGNINVAAAASSSLLSISAVGGSFQALNGLINVGDLSGILSTSIKMQGGDYLSRQLNLNAGCQGDVQANIAQVSGIVNAYCRDIVLNATSEHLTLGNIDYTADPLITNWIGNDLYILEAVTVGDINLSSMGNIFANCDISSSSGSVTLDARMGISVQNITAANLITLRAADATLGSAGTPAGDITVGSVSTPGGVVMVSNNGTIHYGSIHASTMDLEVNSESPFQPSMSALSFNKSAYWVNLALYNFGSGGIRLSDSLVVPGSAYYGGKIDIEAPQGPVVINSDITAQAPSGYGFMSGNILISGKSVSLSNATISANGDSKNLAGAVTVYSSDELAVNGNVKLRAVGGSGIIDIMNTSTTGPLSITGAGTLEADADGTGGGDIAMVAGTIRVSGDTTVSLHSNGCLDGTNTVSVVENGGSQEIFVGNGPGMISVAADGSPSGGNGGGVVVLSSGNLHVDSSAVSAAVLGGDGTGGYIDLEAGYLGSPATLTLSGDLNASGAGSGDGGSITLLSSGAINSAAGGAHFSANGGASGNGGHITMTSGADITMGGASPQFYLSATGGSAGSESGNGGSIEVDSRANLNVNGPESFNLSALGSQGSGGSLALVAGFSAVNNGVYEFNSQGTLSVGPGTYAANGAGSSDGGSVLLAGAAVNCGIAGGSSGVNVEALSPQGNGGKITVQAGSGDINMNMTRLSVSATGSTVNAGVVKVVGNGNISMKQTLIDAGASDRAGQITVAAGLNTGITDDSLLDASASSASGRAGQIDVSAGNADAGVLTLDSSLIADARGGGSAGAITLTQNSDQPLYVGLLQPDGSASTEVLSASNASGLGGTLTLTSNSSNLNVSLNQKVNLQGSSMDTLGTVDASSQGQVSITGAGSLTGSLNGSGASYAVSLDGAGSIIAVKRVSGVSGGVTVKTNAPDGVLVLSPDSSLTAQAGVLEIGAPSIYFRGNSTLSMGTAGLLKIDAGSQSGSLNIDFAAGSRVTFNVTQGDSVRPGHIAIGPNGSGSLNMNSSGNATLDFTGGTVSLVSSAGAINLGRGLSLNSDAFDTIENVGMEAVATNGDINVNSAISARQLDFSTAGAGNINLACEINSPTVILSVQGNSSINQVGSGSIGIGTVLLGSQSGDIGSSSAPIKTDALELQVSSGGSVFVNNDSVVDIKTSTIANAFLLNNNGDVAVEGNLTAGTLGVNAVGSIAIISATRAAGGILLAVSGTGSNINVFSGAQLSCSAGSINLYTNSLVLDGSILAAGTGSVVNVSGGSDLNLSGAGGHITASGGNNQILLNASNSVTFATAYLLNAGSGGIVQIQTGSLSAAGVTLAAGAALSAAGGSQLNIFSNVLTFGSGSSLNLSSAGTALSCQSTLGAPLTVNVSGDIAINSSAGGQVQFGAGTGGPLTFQSTAAGADLNVTGGQLVTSSTGADTWLNNVSLVASNNIQVSVNGGTLRLNGDITSTLPNGVIVLQDPDGITIAGNGSVGFAAGLSGTILVQAATAGTGLQIDGSPVFNAGSGSVTLASLGTIAFAAGASATVNGGATVNINAPTIAFGSNSQVAASGNSNINVSSGGSSDLNIILPDGGAASISTGGGLISVSTAPGYAINFNQAAVGADTATLNFSGAPVSISTSNANVTIASNVVLHTSNNISVLTPGGTLNNYGQIQAPQSQTIIEAAGPLLINQNVFADSLIIRTTANNGNITFAANVSVTSDLTVSAIGSGSIIEASGLLSAASISLISGSGNIGRHSSRIQVSTADLSVSTAGAAYVNALGPVRVSSYNVGGGLNLTATGDIVIGGDGASTVSINSNGTFNAGPAGTVTVAASSQVSFAAGVKFQVQSSSLNIAAPSISIGNSTGRPLTTISSAGNLSFAGNISGGNMLLSTTASGNVSFNGNLTATNLRVNAGGHGSIIQLAGVLSAPVIELVSARGNIGSSLSPLAVSAEELSAQTGGSGTVNINALGDITVDRSSSGGSFTLGSTGALTIGDVSSDHGSITLTGRGDMQVLHNSSLSAGEGNLIICNNDSRYGTITIGKNSDLIALSSNPWSNLGNIWIVVGSIPASPVKGNAPANLSTSSRWGGQVYFGANGISTGKGRQIQLNAWGSNIVFSTGTRAASAITLEGGVFMLADPPVSAALAAGTSALSLQSVQTAYAGDANLIQAINLAGTVFAAPTTLLARPAGIRSGSEAAADAESLKPVACVSAVNGAAARCSANPDELIESSSSCATRVYKQGALIEVSTAPVAFSQGEMLVDARRFTELKVHDAAITIKNGASALLRSDGHGLEIFNLCEDHWGAVKVSFGGQEFVLGAGQRILIGQTSRVAMRNEKSQKVSDRQVKVGEFSFTAVVDGSDLLNKVLHSQARQDRQLAARLLKMAACLTLVTSTHGAFRN
jgi:mucin-19